MDDQVSLYLRQWESSQVRAVLHIVHGMGEHSLRYARLAERLSAVGIEVWAADMRGHGKTADPAINDPGRGGARGHCADRGGFSRVTRDIDIINRAIRAARPGAPLFLMGHSWGSFIVQNYIETLGGQYPAVAEPVRLAGCVLSGTRGPGGGPGSVMFRLGAGLLSFLTFLGGRRRPTRFFRTLVEQAYLRPFKPTRTSADWLSRDEAEVDRFLRDPYCGWTCSLGFYRDLAGALAQIHQAEALRGVRPDLPIYVFSGTADPVGDMGESPSALENVYRALGVKDLELTLFPDARHETLNETNREEVTESLLSWLLRHT